MIDEKKEGCKKKDLTLRDACKQLQGQIHSFSSLLETSPKFPEKSCFNSYNVIG